MEHRHLVQRRRLTTNRVLHRLLDQWRGVAHQREESIRLRVKNCSRPSVEGWHLALRVQELVSEPERGLADELRETGVVRAELPEEVWPNGLKLRAGQCAGRRTHLRDPRTRVAPPLAVGL